MKKLLTIVLTMAAAAAFAAPSYIYFQVDQMGWTDYAFDYATVRTATDALKIDGGDYYKLYSAADKMTTGEAYAGTFDSAYTGDLIFELWLEDDLSGQLVSSATYKSTAWKDHAYADMSQSGAVAMTVTAVPEPTSAVLLLLGVAGLALRRRRLAAVVD